MDNNNQSSVIAGEIWDEELVSRSYLQDAGIEVPDGVQEAVRYLIKVGNRELTGIDFVWKFDYEISSNIKRTELVDSPT